MILKNIFGKTIEAAKKTATQMYGDNFVVLEASEGNGSDKEAKITVFRDPNSESERPHLNNKTITAELEDEENDVQFVRSATKDNARLNSLRKFAAGQMSANSAPVNNHKTEENTSSFGNLVPHKEEKNASNLYSRKTVSSPSFKNLNTLQTPQTQNSVTDEKESSNRKFITHFKKSNAPAPNSDSNFPSLKVPTTRDEQREIVALHKRFDKLEALLDASLISANLDYASHPAFQQLIHTGINTTTVAGWFSSIIKEGIDPFEHGQLFMKKLAGIIRNSIGDTPKKTPKKYMLFAGSFGSGKTSLIIKMCNNPEFTIDKKIAVVSMYPQDSKQEYYTILEPYCTNNNIPFYKINKGLEVTENVTEWAEYDYVFIDTPGLDVRLENSFKEFWKIRQLLSAVTPLEVHYVVNASSSNFYFRNTNAMSHPIQPDYIALTHLDQISKWGALIPFLRDINCGARYLSVGDNPSQLREFIPEWFVQKIIQDR